MRSLQTREPTLRCTDVEDSGARAWAPLVILGLASLVLAGMIWLSGAPVSPQKATGDAFSVKSAMVYDHTIAETTHPIGSKANAKVRDYLVAQLKVMGLNTLVQRKLVAHRDAMGQVTFAWVENVIGTLPGEQHDDAVLLMAHYDSMPWSPSGSDDGAAVSTLLETAKIMAASNTVRKRDLIVLFTDGEEIGSFGALAFFNDHTLADRVGTVLNFESRGSRGPVLMFQTGPHSEHLVRTLASHGHPVANSYAPALYKLMPNGTDFTISMQHGIPGMNFAFIGGYFDYHSPTDTSSHLSPLTLRHMGDQAVSVTRALLSESAGEHASGSSLHYLNFTSYVFFYYPAWIDPVVLLVSSLLLGFVIFRSMRSKELTVRGLLRASTGALLAAVSALTSVFVLGQALHRFYWPGVMMRAIAAHQEAWFVAWALITVGMLALLLGVARTGMRWPWALLLAAALSLPTIPATGPFLPGIAIAALTWLALRKPCSKTALVHGAMLVCIIAAWILAFLLPGASNLLVWPLLALGIAATLATSKGRSIAFLGRIGTLAYVVAAWIAITSLGVFANNLNLAFGALIPVAGMLPLMLLALSLCVLWLTSRASKSGAILACIGVSVAIVLFIRNPFDARHPMPSSVFALYDQPQEASCLASIDAIPSPWLTSIIGAHPSMLARNNYEPGVWRGTLCAPMPANVASDPPTPVQIESSRLEHVGNTRRLHLRMHAPNGDDVLDIYVPQQVDVQGIGINGQMMKTPKAMGFKKWPIRLRGYAVPDRSFSIMLDIGNGPLPSKLRTIQLNYRMPQGLNIPQRPSDLMPQSHPYSDSTVTVSDISIPAPEMNPAPTQRTNP